MKMSIEISSNNAAFEDDGAVDETVRILQKIINSLELSTVQDRQIYDINGNRVGQFYFNSEAQNEKL